MQYPRPLLPQPVDGQIQRSQEADRTGAGASGLSSVLGQLSVETACANRAAPPTLKLELQSDPGQAQDRVSGPGQESGQGAWNGLGL